MRRRWWISERELDTVHTLSQNGRGGLGSRAGLVMKSSKQCMVINSYKAGRGLLNV